MGSIFNESFAEKKGLWVPWTVHGTHFKSIKAIEMRFSKKKKNADADVGLFISIQTGSKGVPAKYTSVKE